MSSDLFDNSKQFRRPRVFASFIFSLCIAISIQRPRALPWVYAIPSPVQRYQSRPSTSLYGNTISRGKESIMLATSLKSILAELTPSVVRTEKKRVQVYALSDLHADTKKNEDWVRGHCPAEPLDPTVFSVFILPGDAGTEIDRLACVFEILTTNYDAVVYCVGNHESWRRGTASGGSSLSPEKRTPETNRMLHLLQYSFKKKNVLD